MSCPWAKISKPETVNLQDIMSEEVARDLQAKEDKKYQEMLNLSKNHDIINTGDGNTPGTSGVWPTTSPNITPPTTTTEECNQEDNNCKSDELIAQVLQMQYDREHDAELKRTENKFNGTSKVSISLENYKRMPRNANYEISFEEDEEEEEIEDIRDRRDWDRFDTLKRQFASIPPCGYKVQNDGSIITKHDITMSGRKNACKLLLFPPEFQTGDGELFDLKLSNKVFNSLKLHWKDEQSKRNKVHDKEDHATAEFGVDEYTRLIIYKLINQELLEHVDGIVSLGKEAVILHGHYTNKNDNSKHECALKIFKTTLSEFKQREKYIKDDYRFKDRIGKQTTKKTILLWAEKEMHNLHRLKRAQIPCPEVISLKKNVLVMSFIGNDNVAAQKLKDTNLNLVDYILAYDQVTDGMKALYSKANLIHADLSEYNILWYNNQCYFIDVSQSVEPSHENAFYFLMRDCVNILKFFSKKKVPKVLTADELFESITGWSYSDQVKLLEMQEKLKLKPHLINRNDFKMNYDFEKDWEKSKNDSSISKTVVVDPAQA